MCASIELKLENSTKTKYKKKLTIVLRKIKTHSHKEMHAIS